MLSLLIPFQRFFVPALLILLAWSSYRLVIKKDRAVGLALYVGLLIIVDFYYNTGIYIPGLEKGSIRYSEVCALFLLFNTPRAGASSGKNRIIVVLVVSYFILLFISTMRTHNVGVLTEYVGFPQFRRYLVPQILAFVIAFRGFEKKEDYHRFFFHLMCFFLIVGLFIFWDLFFDRWILKSDILNKDIYWSSRRDGRYGGFFLNPNYLGAFAVLLLPVSLLRFFEEGELKRKVYILVCILAFIFSFVETQSRGPAVGMAAALVLFFMVSTEKYRLRNKLGYMALVLAVFMIFLPGFFTHIAERFMHSEEVAVSEKVTVSRRMIWAYTMKIINDNPLFGIGYGETNYFGTMLRYGFRNEYSRYPLDNPHNSYLQIAVYAGIPAMISYILANILLFLRVLTTVLRNKGSQLSIYLMGLLAGLGGFLVTLLVDMHMFAVCVAPVYWIVFGLSLSIINSKDRLVET